MFNPFKRTQDKIAARMVKRIAEANEAPEAPFQVELLLATREDSQAQLKKVERAQGDIALGAVVVSFASLGLVVAGVTAGIFASPLFLIGAGAMALSTGTMFGLGKAVDALRADRDTIDAKIMQDVKRISDAAPEDAKKSKRFNDALISVFNTAADPKAEAAYATLSARHTPKASAKAAPAAYYHDIH
jgi:hypothetical protein